MDEVIVFNDGQNHKFKGGQDYRNEADVDEKEHTGWTDPDHFLYHLLSYLEMPPFLRRTLFPFHPNLKTAGSLPSMDMPHHLRSHEWCPYREGVTLADSKDHPNRGSEESPRTKRPKQSSDPNTVSSDGSSSTTLVDVGTRQKMRIPTAIPPNTRVTLKVPRNTESSRRHSAPEPELTAEAVHPSAPREEAGYYWGYALRRAPSLSAVFTECPHDGGYDLSIGTSERGKPLSHLLGGAANGSTRGTSSANAGLSQGLATNWNHLLVVFGGPSGIEAAVSADKELVEAGVKDAKEVFDAWVNVCPGQGSRTIRTEEAVWVGLTSLRDFVRQRNKA